MDALKSLEVLRDSWIKCERCGLAASRRKKESPLFGVGSHNAHFLVVMDAPSEDDMLLGEYLSDEAGHLVIDLLKEAGIKEEDVFFTTVVGCRPFTVVPATEESEAREQTRDPAKEEVAACSPRLNEIIYLVDPRLIIAMGDLPWKTLVLPKDRHKYTTISAAAGEIFDTWVRGRADMVRYPVLATVSGKQIIKDPSSAVHGPLAATLASLTKAGKYVNHLLEDEKK